MGYSAGYGAIRYGNSAIGEEERFMMTQPLAAVAAYDPYIARAVDGIRRALADGHPVMIRLHAGGSYEAPNRDASVLLDREGHAVLIVGYDDSLRAFEVADPIDGENRFLTYEEFGMLVVDSTKDFALIAAPVQVLVTPAGDRVSVQVGLYAPSMPLIDENEPCLTDVSLVGDFGAIALGDARLGDSVSVSLAKRSLDSSVVVEGTLRGSRPLPYERSVRVEVALGLLVRA